MEQLDKILENPRYSAADRQVIQRAFDVAYQAHTGQKRKSGDDYIIHPLSVANFLSQMGLDAATIAAALLHDTLEDTSITHDELEKLFGKEITFLVDGVTKLKSITYNPSAGFGKTKVGRNTSRDTGDPHIESLKKMFFAMAEDIRVILIKLADRYHNIKTLKWQPPEAQRRIALETLEIYAPIAARLGMGYLKGELEDSSFPYAYPENYRILVKSIKDKYDDRIKYIERTKPIIRRHLQDAGIPITDIHSRAKHYWSLYQKMGRYTLDDAEKIYDLVALRVIVPDIKSCYEALGIIHKYYKPLPGRIKDYIALPKPNGYRSLHTTVFCEKGRIAEIQIRTPEMHDHAENGIAAHWAYSESGKRRTGTAARTQELAWINQLKDVLKDIKTREGLGNLKIDFFKYRIFAFTPQGDVKDLPGGATPIDFAYAIHSGLGNSVAGARINAKIVPLDRQLKNGDVVEIIKSKTAHPSMDWLKIVKTTEAQKQIRSWFKKNDPTIAVSNGRNILNKALAEHDTSFDKLSREKLNQLLKTFSAKTSDDLLVRISLGDLPTHDVVRHIVDKSKARNSKPEADSKAQKPKPKRSTLAAQPSRVVIQGETGLMYKLAKCCKPSSGDPIRGYITRAKGVTVHKLECANIKGASRERLLSAQWT